MELEREEYERLLHRSRLMDLAQDILIVLDVFGTVIDVNGAAAEMHGGVVDDLIGRNCADFLHPSSARQMAKVAGAMFRRGEDCTDSMELQAIRHDGSMTHLQIRVSYSIDAERFYVVERDVTDQVQRTQKLVALSEELRIQARTDTLTSIANRAAFDDAMATVETLDGDAWLVIIDIDDFKAVNDSFGHLAGDGLLQWAAEKMSSMMGPEELVARLGGDEFAMIMPEVDESEFQQRLEELGHLVNQRACIDGLELNPRFSYGAARRAPGEGMADWMRRADRAMYCDKAESPRTVQAA